MRIGIIGAGEIGGTLARRWVELGHEVRVANSRGPESLVELAAATGATPVTVAEAVVDREVVVVTIPMVAVGRLPAGLFAAVDPGTLVIDTCNYFPRQRDGRIDEIEDGMPESRWVEGQLGRPVVKVFNTIDHLPLGSKGRPSGARGRIAVPVAGDEAAARRRAMDLVEELGFDPVDAGPIEESWRQQPDSPVFGANLDAEWTRWGLGAASPERPARFTA
jgi:8-hydroxy-5-deazaflavin:NADPH oxidoreductase